MTQFERDDEGQRDWQESYRIAMDQCTNLLIALGDAIQAPQGIVPPTAKPYIALIETARSKHRV